MKKPTDVIRTAIQYTDKTNKAVVRANLAAYFGVDNYFVARSFRNTAAEGATNSACDPCSITAATAWPTAR